VRLTVLGVGDAFSRLGYSTCFLVEHGGFSLLIDCPHPIRKVLYEAGAPDLDQIDAALITHLHGDHCSGLEGLLWFCRFALGRKARIVAHPAVLARTWERLAPGMDTLRDDLGGVHGLTLDELAETAQLSTTTPVQIGPFSIEARLTKHHIPTTALRISAGGSTLAYSCDTSFDPALLEWLSIGDLVIHETNLGIHTPIEDLLEVAEPLRSKLALVHYPDDFDVEGCELRCLRAGEVVEL
jgi:ribonuclease BN (tRNA processing enzyme)